MRETIVLGVDGGGTQTRALLARADGTILGLGRAGASNVNSVGVDVSLGVLFQALSGAWKEAGMSSRPVSAAFLGLSGIEASGKKEALQRRFADSGLVEHARCFAAMDAEAALAGGLAGRPGIVLIAGSGSFCLGRDADGKVARCGGWGWLLDDVGSGAYLGREALRAAVMASDGRGKPTSLAPRVLAHAGVDQPGKLVSWLHSNTAYGATLAGLAKIVTSEAEAGDLVARRILHEGAKALGELVKHVASHLSWPTDPELVLAGGVARSGIPYQPLIEAEIRQAVRGIKIVNQEFPPAAGAVLRALAIAGVQPTPQMLARFREECSRVDLR